MCSRLSLLFLALFTVSALAAIDPHYQPDLLQQAREKRLAFSPGWIKLLHYKKRWVGGYESEADGLDFFLAEKGKTDPEAELEATLKAMLAGNALPPRDKEDEEDEKDRTDYAVCKFPARARWLKASLGLHDDVFPLRACPKYFEFRDNLSAKSASIVFSSYYLNNPASAFGHSLLRLNRAELAYDGKRFELLDSGINYAAVVTTENPVLYAVYGLFGLFKGTFTRIPYYYKVREYNDFESRDLWVYDLNLTPEQVDRLVMHLWELGSTYFDYWYLSENCSYHILTAIEAAVPELDLTGPLPWVVVPADTIKVINRVPGFVARVHYHPSVRSQFATRVAPLSDPQKDALKNLVASRDLADLPASLTDAERASVLDAAIDQVDFKSFKKLIYEPEGPESKWKQSLLVSRARIPITSEVLSVPTPTDEMPHVGHEIARAGFDVGGSNSFGPFGVGHFRFALHDLLDPKAGYPEYSQIEFFNTRIRYVPQNGQAWLEDLSLFRVISLSPWTEFDLPTSWKVKLGATTIRDNACDHCAAAAFEGGAGFAFNLPGRVTTFFSLDGEAHVTPGFSPRSLLRPGVGPSLLLRARFSKDIVAWGQASYRYRIFTDEAHAFSAFGELRWAIAENLALNVKSALFPDTWENSAGVYFYF